MMMRSLAFLGCLAVAGCAGTPDTATLSSVTAPATPPPMAVPAPPMAATAPPAPAIATTGAAGVSFAGDVAPLLARRCASCHGPGGEGADDAVFVDANGKAVFADVKAQLGAILGAVQGGRMPKGGAKLSADELDVLRRWQQAGAPADGAAPAPTPTPSVGPSATPSPAPRPTAGGLPPADLTARITASTHLALWLGHFTCTVQVKNVGGVARTGKVTLTFLHGGSPESGSPAQSQAVTVPAAGAAQLTFTDATWHLLSEDASVAVVTDAYVPGATPPPAVSFRGAVAPLLVQRCAGCHAPGQKGASKVQIFATPGQVDRGVVAEAIARIVSAVQAGEMPQGGTPLTADERAALEQWEAAGTPDN